MYWRIFKLKESAVWRQNKASQKGKAGSTSATFGPLFKLYWHRLMATAVGWFLWDFRCAFYAISDSSLGVPVVVDLRDVSCSAVETVFADDSMY